MDNFREWLSDNLRYFMLGGAILLIVAVLFFGVRACVGSKKGNSDNETNKTAQNNQENDPSSPVKDGETDDEKKDANPLEEANADVLALAETYYKALEEKDIETLRSIEVDLSPADELRVTNAKDYIEKYTVSEVYTKKGLTDGSYVVYVCFNYTCKGIDTPVPALSQIYVITDAEDQLKIDAGAISNQKITEYTDNLLITDEDVRELRSKVRAQYEKAQEEDSALAEFLSGLGEDAGTSTDAEDGAVLTVTETCNVRAAADSNAEIIDVYPAGTEVEKLGAEGEWVQIKYYEETAYIHNSLLE